MDQLDKEEIWENYLLSIPFLSIVISDAAIYFQRFSLIRYRSSPPLRNTKCF